MWLNFSGFRGTKIYKQDRGEREEATKKPSDAESRVQHENFLFFCFCFDRTPASLLYLIFIAHERVYIVISHAQPREKIRARS